MPIDAILTRLERTCAVCPDRGVPLVVHHGTFAQFDRFAVTRDIGFHFGSRKAADSRRRHAPLRPGHDGPASPQWRVIAACLDLRNPLELEIDAGSWNPHPLLTALRRALPEPAHARIASRVEAAIAAVAEINAEIDRQATARLAARPLDEAKIAARLDRLRQISPLSDPAALEKDIRDKMWKTRRAAIGTALEQEFRPALAALETPYQAIRAGLEALGHDGIVYINRYEARRQRALSWVAFADSAIIQLGENLALDTLPASPAQLAAHGFPRSGVALTAPAEDARAPGVPIPTPQYHRRFGAAMKRAVAAADDIGRQDLVGASWSLGRSKIRLFLGGIEYAVDLAIGEFWSLRVRGLAGPDYRSGIVANWPEYKTAAEAAAIVMAEIREDRRLIPPAIHQKRQQQIRAALTALCDRSSVVTGPAGRALVLHVPATLVARDLPPIGIGFTTRAQALADLGSSAFTSVIADNTAEPLRAACLLLRQPLCLPDLQSIAYRILPDPSADHVWLMGSRARLLAAAAGPYFAADDTAAMTASALELDAAMTASARRIGFRRSNADPDLQARWRYWLAGFEQALRSAGYDSLCIGDPERPAQQRWYPLDAASIIALPDGVAADLIDRSLTPGFDGLANPMGSPVTARKGVRLTLEEPAPCVDSRPESAAPDTAMTDGPEMAPAA